MTPRAARYAPPKLCEFFRACNTAETLPPYRGTMTFQPSALDSSPHVIAPLSPHTIVLFGATGDLAKRKLLPGMLRLFAAGLLPNFRIIGTSLDQIDSTEFRARARRACEQFAPPGM